MASIADGDFSESLQHLSATQLLATERHITDNSIRQTKECTVNDKGYITRMVFKNTAGATSHTYEFTYDTEGYLVNKKGITPTGTVTDLQYNIVNGNIVNTKTYHDGILSRTDEYTTDYTKANKIMQVPGAYWIGTSYFGKPLSNLWKEIKSTNAAGAVTWHTQINYEMDAAGYPVKTMTNFLLDGKQSVQTFNYQ